MHINSLIIFKINSSNKVISILLKVNLFIQQRSKSNLTNVQVRFQALET